MNHRMTKFGIGIVIGAACFLSAAFAGAQQSQPVFVELFTSQGCAACPPADAHLSELKDRPNVVAIAWHVDYWDDKGWKDPFSDTAYSQRQISYAKTFQSERIFTPQMIVDGQTGFNGSDRKKAAKVINEAERQPKSRVFLVAEPIAESPHTVFASIRFERGASSSAGNPTGIIVVVIEDNISMTIDLGENGGKTLHHDAVARWARIAGETDGDVFENSVRVPLGRSWKADDLHLIAFAQDSQTQRVLAARRIGLADIIARD